VVPAASSSSTPASVAWTCVLAMRDAITAASRSIRPSQYISVEASGPTVMASASWASEPLNWLQPTVPETWPSAIVSCAEPSSIATSAP